MRGNTWAAALAIVLLGTNSMLGTVAYAAPPSGFHEAVLQIQVNESAASEMVVTLRDADGSVWLEEGDFARLRLRTPDREPLIVDRIRYFRLQAIAGASVAVEETTQQVSLTVPATAFAGTSIEVAERQSTVVPQANFGGFLNYQFSGERDNYSSASAESATFGTAFTELGVFGPHGVVTSSAIGQFLEDKKRGIRLESTWTYDFPERLQTIRVGDAISSSAQWSRSARFGGVQWGSNFAVRPDLVTSPFLSAAGEAVVPSTVDVFINNQQITSQQVPAGPFVIDRLPAISGAGDVRLVVRDAFGREQVITAPFYSSPVLLREDLSQYSVELGKVREDYAISSNRYGALLASATYRRGLTNSLTLEGHGESQQSGPHALGLNAAWRIGNIGVVSATLAQGADDSSSGMLTAVGFDRGGRRFSITGRSQFASDGFRQVGDSLLLQRPKQQHVLQTSANFSRIGSFSLAYAIATYQGQARRQTGTLSHNISISHIGYLGFSVSHTLSEPKATGAFLILTAPLGPTRSASLTARYDKDTFFEERELVAMFQQNPPVGNGSGYRLSASTAGNYSGSWLGQFDYAAIEAEAAKYLETSAVRATLTGAAVALGGDIYTTRSFNDSFALVDVAGIPDIDVMVDNQVVRRTDRNGRAFVRNLRAYEENRLSVDPRQLPLDTRIDSDKLKISPRYRSGLIVKFAIAHERSATFKLVLPSGRPVPAGAEVVFKGNRFPVALDGLVFVTGFDHGLSAEAEWNGGRCTFRVDAPVGDDPLPDLGIVACQLQ